MENSPSKIEMPANVGIISIGWWRAEKPDDVLDRKTKKICD